MKLAFLGLLAAATILVAGCSSDSKPVITTASEESSDAILKRDCADPKWKQENLGLWYSVCRRPMNW
ncbi:MAG: hypothetical protein ACREFB_07170 [Stellaceae bacterium]